jgi:hypothetical protein
MRLTAITFRPEHFNPRANATIPACWVGWVDHREFLLGDTREEVLALATREGCTIARNVKRGVGA